MRFNFGFFIAFLGIMANTALASDFEEESVEEDKVLVSLHPTISSISFRGDFQKNYVVTELDGKTIKEESGFKVMQRNFCFVTKKEGSHGNLVKCTLKICNIEKNKKAIKKYFLKEITSALQNRTPSEINILKTNLPRWLRQDVDFYRSPYVYQPFNLDRLTDSEDYFALLNLFPFKASEVEKLKSKTGTCTLRLDSVLSPAPRRVRKKK